MRPVFTRIQSSAQLLPLALVLAIPQPATAQNSHQQNAASTMKDYQKRQKKQIKKDKSRQNAAQKKWRKQHHVTH